MNDRRSHADRRTTLRTGDRRRGRPRIAVCVSQLPACAVSTAVHDAVALEAIRRGVSVAHVIRDALFSHLKNSVMRATTSH